MKTVIRAYDAYRFRKKKGKIPAYDFQQAKQGPRPPVLCWRRFRPVISAREIPTPTLRNQRSGATSAGGSVRHTLRHTRPSRFQVSPILSTGPNGILAPPLRERACRRDFVKQSAHMLNQVKKLRTTGDLNKKTLLISSG